MKTESKWSISQIWYHIDKGFPVEHIASLKEEVPMPQKSPYTILLTDIEQAKLGVLSRQYTAPYYQVIRAKIILFASEGLGNDQISERLDIPRKSVVKWRQRFHHERLDGLADQPRPGRPADFSP